MATFSYISTDRKNRSVYQVDTNPEGIIVKVTPVEQSPLLYFQDPPKVGSFVKDEWRRLSNKLEVAKWDAPFVMHLIFDPFKDL